MFVFGLRVSEAPPFVGNKNEQFDVEDDVDGEFPPDRLEWEAVPGISASLVTRRLISVRCSLLLAK